MVLSRMQADDRGFDGANGLLRTFTDFYGRVPNNISSFLIPHSPIGRRSAARMRASVSPVVFSARPYLSGRPRT